MKHVFYFLVGCGTVAAFAGTLVLLTMVPSWIWGVIIFWLLVVCLWSLGRDLIERKNG